MTIYKKGSPVVYPIYGAGKIIRVYDQKIGEETKKYYKIAFDKSTIDVSVPADNAEEMGMRKPLAQSTVKKKISSLQQNPRAIRREPKNLKISAKEMLETGDMDDAISVINTIRGVEKKKEKEGKALNTTISNLLENAQRFLRSEIITVLGKRAARDIAKKYSLNSQYSVRP